jgi:hypothetical protein
VRIAAVVVFAVSGCRSILGIDDVPALDRDAAVDGAVDATVDAVPDAFDPAGCPPAYSAITGGNPSSRYRHLGVAATFWAHHADCNDDGPGIHLVVLGDVDEAIAVGVAHTGIYYVGIAQQPSQLELTSGWHTFHGTPLPLPWAAGEPDDDGDFVENGGEQLAALEPQTGAVHDMTGDFVHTATCECDGIPIDPSVTIPLPP